MPLGPGVRLGPYEVVAAIGAGGMGDVYRARDSRLGRDVAIKVLPPLFSTDPDRLARFEQEARAAAALNHSNILAVFDIGTHDGAPYIVSELLEGETLREKIGGLSVRKTIDYAIQIAHGLAAAHDKGIVHRDLKPENVFVTADGHVKILDFGLAKLTQAESSLAGMSVLPTTPGVAAGHPHTIAGVVLGTVGYMAPEQVRGLPADHRSDIFALGAIVYEMLSGRRAFHGDTAMDTMTAILKEDPPDLEPTTRHAPPALGRIVDKCLEKVPAARFQSAGDLAFALEGVTSSDTTLRSPAVAPRRRVWSAAVAATIVIAAMGIAYAILQPRGTPSRSLVAHLTVALPEGDQLADPIGPSLAISPDGSQLVYVAIHAGTTQLFARPVGALEYKAIPATEGAAYPFFSPDGRTVAFFSQGKLKTVSLAAGRVQVICNAPYARGGSWGADDILYFAATNTSGLSKVAASGGTPTEVTTIDRAKGEISHRWPQVLPGGKAVLFTAWTGPARDEHSVQVVSLDTGERRVLMQGAEAGRYVSTGHLLYARQDQLVAVPMNLERLQVSDATTTTLPEYVRIGGEGAAYAISEAGTLVYIAGGLHRNDRRMVWVDRTGHVEPLPTPPRFYDDPALSPDGRLAAVSVFDSTIEIWIYDLARNTFTRLTGGAAGSSQAPLWTPDGTHIVYRGTRSGFRNLFSKAIDRGGDEERLTTRGGTAQTPQSWSPDGKRLVFTDLGAATSTDIVVLSLEGDRQPRAFLATSAAEDQARISPEGKWLAYRSDESGKPEIYVQPFPDPGQRWQISTDGGEDPVWSRDGRELFYVHLEQLMAVAINTNGTFSAGPPRPLFSVDFAKTPTASRSYAVSPDGRRFLFIQAVEPAPAANQIQIVMNWFDELKK